MFGSLLGTFLDVGVGADDYMLEDVDDDDDDDERGGPRARRGVVDWSRSMNCAF